MLWYKLGHGTVWLNYLHVRVICRALNKTVKRKWEISTFLGLRVLNHVPGLHSSPLLRNLQCIWALKHLLNEGKICIKNFRKKKQKLNTSQESITDKCYNNYLGREKSAIIRIVWGLPWWLSGEESACQCRRHRFESWSGKIPHATEQLSLCSRAWEPQQRNHCSEKPLLESNPAHRN